MLSGPVFTPCSTVPEALSAPPRLVTGQRVRNSGGHIQCNDAPGTEVGTLYTQCI